jgi:DNA-binding IclR family transcriptional regulator
MTDEADDTDDAGDTDRLRPIRALTRGLEALEALNARGVATVTDIARAIGLPRTTAYRVLETLCAAGYAERTPDDRYRLLARVHRLADGCAPEPWLARVVVPATAALARDLSWPLLFAVPAGNVMRAHVLGTEPRVPERLSMTSAAGLAYMAACTEASRAAVVTQLGLDPQAIAVKTDDVARRGAALVDDDASQMLAVGVVARGVSVGALAVSFPKGALADQAIDRITALLVAAAADIGAGWSG